MLNGRNSRLRRALVAAMLAFTLAFFIPTQRAQAAGELDPTFGTDGKLIVTFPGNGGANAMLLLPDGKVVTAGRSGAGFALARVTTTGTLDPSFGNGGTVTTQFPGFLIGADAIARQADGKIIAGGLALDVNANPTRWVFGLARYTADGVLDPTFDIDGVVTTPFFASYADVLALGIQADGKIVAAGTSSPLNDGNSQDFALVRYNPDGSLDNSFGVGGKVSTDIYGFSDQIHSLLIQPDGKILVGGQAGTSTLESRFIVARYLANGTLDQGFGTNGLAPVALSSRGAAAALALRPNGHILAAGSIGNEFFSNFAVVEFSAGGELAPSFGSNGTVTTDFFGSTGYAQALSLRPDGSFVLGGSAYSPANQSYQFALASYSASGDLDPSFGTNGKVMTPIFNHNDLIYGLAVQPDGNIIAAGIAATLTQDVMVVARYRGNQTSFDLCVQDDSSGNLLQLNSASGAYLFTNCSGVSVGGTGTLTRRGSLITLQHNAADRRVMATIDANTHRASASIQMLTTGTSFSITDRNTANNTCACK